MLIQDSMCVDGPWRAEVSDSDAAVVGVLTRDFGMFRVGSAIPVARLIRPDPAFNSRVPADQWFSAATAWTATIIGSLVAPGGRTP